VKTLAKYIIGYAACCWALLKGIEWLLGVV